MIDIIIPVLNEEKILREQAEYYRALNQLGRLTFVDGGSDDATVAVAGDFGRVLRTRPGRSYQKNFGAAHAEGDYFLFLHVDSFINEDVVAATRQAFRRGAQAGCFTMRIRDHKPLFRLYEWAVNQRARRQGIIDGDLGMFVRRDVFESLGGFDRLIIMDDIVFSKRLRRRFAVTVMNSVIEVSARKWQDQGFLKTFCQYSLAYLQLWTGILFFRDDDQINEDKTSADYFCQGTQTRSRQDAAFDGS